jgi:hypothetical protein
MVFYDSPNGMTCSSKLFSVCDDPGRACPSPSMMGLVLKTTISATDDCSPEYASLARQICNGSPEIRQRMANGEDVQLTGLTDGFGPDGRRFAGGGDLFQALSCQNFIQ